MKTKISLRCFITIGFVFLLGLVATACRTGVSSDFSVHGQQSSELINWLGWTNAPERIKRGHPGLDYEICNELLSRREVDFLLASLNNMPEGRARTLLVVRVLYLIDDQRIADAFAARLNDQETVESYFIANYLAQRGNTAALAMLNRHYGRYPISSYQWAYTVALFGKYHYQPAASNLVESLEDPSLNLSYAASVALHELFPDSPTDFKTPAEAKAYYLNRLAQTQPGK